MSSSIPPEYCQIWIDIRWSYSLGLFWYHIEKKGKETTGNKEKGLCGHSLTEGKHGEQYSLYKVRRINNPFFFSAICNKSACACCGPADMAVWPFSSDCHQMKRLDWIPLGPIDLNKAISVPFQAIITPGLVLSRSWLFVRVGLFYIGIHQSWTCTTLLTPKMRGGYTFSCPGCV